MILYIYSVKDFKSHQREFFSCDNINIENQNNEIVKGFISIDTGKVMFIYNVASNLLYLNADKRSKKRKAFKILYECLNKDIAVFRPSFDKERKMICEASNKTIKFLHDNKLEYSKSLTNKYCENSINDDYYLFEATLRYDDYEFMYYRNAIKFKDQYENYTGSIIGLIEKYLGE